MWTLFIILGFVFLIVLLIKMGKEPEVDENIEFLITQKLLKQPQHVSSSQSNDDFEATQQPYARIKKTYQLHYDCAYDFESYPFEIVGEASYQSNISKFAVLRDGKGCFTEVEARIVREPHNSYDKNACRVDINGSVVGYFARNNAESWVRLLDKLNISDASEVYVRAVIIGGKNQDQKFGVRLDIPSRVANCAKYITES